MSSFFPESTVHYRYVLDTPNSRARGCGIAGMIFPVTEIQPGILVGDCCQRVAFADADETLRATRYEPPKEHRIVVRNV